MRVCALEATARVRYTARRELRGFGDAPGSGSLQWSPARRGESQRTSQQMTGRILGTSPAMKA